MKTRSRRVRKSRKISEELKGTDLEPEETDSIIGSASELFEKAISSKTDMSLSQRIKMLKKALGPFERHKWKERVYECKGWIARLRAEELWKNAVLLHGKEKIECRAQSIKYTQTAKHNFSLAEDWENAKRDETTWEKRNGVIESYRASWHKAKTHFNNCICLADKRPKDPIARAWCLASLYEVEARILEATYLANPEKFGHKELREIAKLFRRAERSFRNVGDENGAQKNSCWKSGFIWLSNPAPENNHHRAVFKTQIERDKPETEPYGRHLTERKLSEQVDGSSWAAYLKMIDRSETNDVFDATIRDFESWLLEQRDKLGEHDPWYTLTIPKFVEKSLPRFSALSGVSYGNNLDWAVKRRDLLKHKKEDKMGRIPLESDRELIEQIRLEVYIKKDIVLNDLPLEISDFKTRLLMWVASQIAKCKPKAK